MFFCVYSWWPAIHLVQLSSMGSEPCAFGKRNLHLKQGDIFVHVCRYIHVSETSALKITCVMRFRTNGASLRNSVGASFSEPVLSYVGCVGPSGVMFCLCALPRSLHHATMHVIAV